MEKIARVVNRSIRNMVNAEYDKFRERAKYELSQVEKLKKNVTFSN